LDFIERWFGLSPDGGDGSTEALYLIAIVVVLALVVGWRFRKSFGRRRN
jgi:hypothetical protein